MFGTLTEQVDEQRLAELNEEVKNQFEVSYMNEKSQDS